MNNIAIIKNILTSTEVYTNYSILKDEEFVASAVYTVGTQDIEVFKKHDKELSLSEISFVIKSIKDRN